MKLPEKLQRQIVNDLGLNRVFVKGENIPVNNCWHFCSNGAEVDVMFYDDDDFRSGMNRAYVLSLRHGIIILAFNLMDSHVHFVLYGLLEECRIFANSYMRGTARHIQRKHGDRHKLQDVSVSLIPITDDLQLKNTIAYTLRNPTTGGLRYTWYNYPWGSGPLYFQKTGTWCSPHWLKETDERLDEKNFRERRMILEARPGMPKEARIVDDIILPAEYVAYEIVEAIFRTERSFCAFLGRKCEDEIERMQGMTSRLSLPLKELRQFREEIKEEMFGGVSWISTNVEQRLKVAKMLRSRFYCSPKQICRVCGLSYQEVKDLLF